VTVSALFFLKWLCQIAIATYKCKKLSEIILRFKTGETDDAVLLPRVVAMSLTACILYSCFLVSKGSSDPVAIYSTTNLQSCAWILLVTNEQAYVPQTSLRNAGEE